MKLVFVLLLTSFALAQGRNIRPVFFDDYDFDNDFDGYDFYDGFGNDSGFYDGDSNIGDVISGGFGASLSDIVTLSLLRDGDITGLGLLNDGSQPLVPRGSNNLFRYLILQRFLEDN